MAGTDLKPFTPDLLRHNWRVMAERVGWPDGAVEACERILEAFPDWVPGWQHESKIAGFEHPAGFYASRHHRRYDEPSAYGADPVALVVAITTWPHGHSFGSVSAWNPPPITRFIPGQRCYGSAGPEDDDCEYRWAHGEHPVGEMPAR